MAEMRLHLLFGLPIAAAVVVAAASGTCGDLAPPDYRKNFIADCSLHYGRDLCASTAALHHGRCLEKAKLGRTQELGPAAVDTNKYHRCIMSEIATQEYNSMTISEREAKGLRRPN